MEKEQAEHLAGAGCLLVVAAFVGLVLIAVSGWLLSVTVGQLLVVGAALAIGYALGRLAA